MVDIVDAATRSRMMAGIRSRNTKPEVALRKALFAKGLRYRLNVRNLPGRPDIVLPGRQAVVFVHGCFWHGHACGLFRIPATRPEFWTAKIGGNQLRDRRVQTQLAEQGWRVCTVWECALRGKGQLGIKTIADLVALWLYGETGELTIRGR